MAYSAQDQTQYLDPNTSQYYTEQTYQPMQNNYGFMGGGMNNSYRPNFMGLGGMFGNNYGMPRTIRKNTGDISMVNKAMQNRQPYQYNVPSVAQMFPLMAMPNMDFSQYQGGAGRFLGGLLGNAPMTANNIAMPTPVSTVAVK